MLDTFRFPPTPPPPDLAPWLVLRPSAYLSRVLLTPLSLPPSLSHNGLLSLSYTDLHEQTAPGRTSFRHHHTGGGNIGPAAAAVGLRPAYAAAVAAGVEGAAAERLVSSYAATRSTARMGVVGAGVGRAVGRGLAAAAFATVSVGGGVVWSFWDA